MIDDLEITDYDELDNCTISIVSKQERAPVRIFEGNSTDSESETGVGIHSNDKQLKKSTKEIKGQEVACFKSIADIVKILPYVKKFKKVRKQNNLSNAKYKIT